MNGAQPLDPAHDGERMRSCLPLQSKTIISSIIIDKWRGDVSEQ